MSSKIVDQAREGLKKLADRNHDGRIDRQDIEKVLGPLEQKAKDQTVAHPFGALLTVAAIAFVLGVLVARMLS